MKTGVKSPAKAKGKVKAEAQRMELGQYIVADPMICHGTPTVKGTRIMIWQVLDELAHGMSPEEIVKAWGGRVPLAAVFECVAGGTRSVGSQISQVRLPQRRKAVRTKEGRSGR
jgi:uncharacterized protein (DUF433 family)